MVSGEWGFDPGQLLPTAWGHLLQHLTSQRPFVCISWALTGPLVPTPGALGHLVLSHVGSILKLKVMPCPPDID